MSFLQEKQSRRYFLFIFSAMAVLLCAGIFLTWYHGTQMKSLLFQQRLTIASSLLERKISPEAIAASFKNTSVSPAGASFLEETGYGEALSLWLIPSLRQSVLLFFLYALLMASAIGFLLFFGTLYFLRARNRLYIQAVKTISEFAEGNFQNHLPSEESGALFQLFLSVEQLATALQAKSSGEHKAKEFLKDTLSDISHQLKTPIAALKLYLDIMIQEPDNPETVKKFSLKSQSSLERMERLILTLLKMMRLDAGSIVFDKKHYPVPDLIRQSVRDHQTRAAVEGKTLLLKGPDDAVLFCDPSWTEEALSNLIKNALDHTRGGDTVTILWTSSPGLFRLSVEDTGEGIDPLDFPHIFKRFYRSGHSLSASGFGLGLPLAKSIIEDQGGTLFAESIPGRGSVFTISFLTDL